jgi:hypothetical protein
MSSTKFGYFTSGKEHGRALVTGRGRKGIGKDEFFIPTTDSANN